MHMGALNKYQVCIELQLVLFLSANWMLVGTPRPVNAIVILHVVILQLIVNRIIHVRNTGNHLIVCKKNELMLV